MLMKSMRRDSLSWKDIGWKLADGQQLWREVLIGAVPGIVLAFGILGFNLLGDGLRDLLDPRLRI